MGLAESHAAAVKHTVITIEKTMWRIKRCNSSGGWPLRKQRRRGSPAAVTSYGVSEVAQDVALLPLAGLSDRE